VGNLQRRDAPPAEKEGRKEAVERGFYVQSSCMEGSDHYSTLAGCKSHVTVQGKKRRVILGPLLKCDGLGRSYRTVQY
jgi:hypothetical protein